MLKKVYIAHPLRGLKPYTREVCEANKREVDSICKSVSKITGVVPFSPLHAFSFIDAIDGDPDQAMEYCYSLLISCHELWVFGDWLNSEGVLLEILKFVELGRTVRFVDIYPTASGDIMNEFNQYNFSSQHDQTRFLEFMLGTMAQYISNIEYPREAAEGAVADLASLAADRLEDKIHLLEQKIKDIKEGLHRRRFSEPTRS